MQSSISIGVEPIPRGVFRYQEDVSAPALDFTDFQPDFEDAKEAHLRGDVWTFGL